MARILFARELGASPVRKSLAAILSDGQFKERADAFAAKYRHFDPKSVVSRIARRVAAHCEKV